MRRLLVFAVLTLGCRAPTIPAEPRPHEYAVYTALLEQASTEFPRELSFEVDSMTLTPNQNELQFEQCLPARMVGVFDSAPPAILASTSSNEWLKLGDGRSAYLHPHNGALSFNRPTVLFRVTRVAFTRLGSDGYLWVDHRTCRPNTLNPACDSGSGALVHARKSGDSWTFEDTTCQTIVFPT